MKKILFAALLSLSLTIFLIFSGCSGGLDYVKAGLAAAHRGDYDRAIEINPELRKLTTY